MLRRSYGGPGPTGRSSDSPTSAGDSSLRPRHCARPFLAAWLDGGVSITVTDVPERERFEAHDEGGALAGVLTYQLTGGIVAYTHTKVEPEFEHHGVGSLLARTAMDDARSKGRTVVPICP